MAKTIKIKSSSTNFVIDKSGASYHLASNDTLSYAGIGTGMADIDNIRLKIDGTVTEGSYGLSIGSASSTGNRITIGETGVIDNADDPVELIGNKTTLVNRGTILAYKAENSIGISSIGDNARIVNEGFIKASSAVVISGDGNVVVNSGEISTFMSMQAIHFNSASGEQNRFVNSGTVIGAGNAVAGGDGDEIVINRGKLLGDIELEAGNDVLNIKHGIAGDVFLGSGNDKVVVGEKGLFTEVYAGAGEDILDFRKAFDFGASSTISGGSDDDVFLVSRDDLHLEELAGGGHDTVKSTVSFTLADQFEDLVLIGSKSANGTGNAAVNVLTGNDARNRLNGMAGMDDLAGGRGNDVLTGGMHADLFFFEYKTGKDIITDFTDASDKIDLSGYNHGIQSFDDLGGRIAQDGADVVITLKGGDQITVENFMEGNLTMADFQF